MTCQEFADIARRVDNDADSCTTSEIIAGQHHHDTCATCYIKMSNYFLHHQATMPPQQLQEGLQESLRKCVEVRSQANADQELNHAKADKKANSCSRF
jgi:hypothetical protein